MSIVGQDLHSETHVHGFVTTAEVAKTEAKTGAWVSGLFGVLTAAAVLFVPGAGLLVVLGPLAAGTLAAAQGATADGGLAAVLGHFIAKTRAPIQPAPPGGQPPASCAQPQPCDARQAPARHDRCRS